MNKTISPWLALVIVLTAPLLSVIDVFIINVAIPSIKSGVHATDAQVQLVIASYLLGYAAFLITGGRSGDHYGRKRTFFWGMIGFTIFSCLCGISQTPNQLNMMRFFQGVSAAFMVPQAIAFIQILFSDPKERSKAIGWFGITLGLASVIGQVLGGYFAGGHFFITGWRLIFLVNLPIGIVSLLAAYLYLPETEKHNSVKMDMSGVLILTLALFSLIYPLIQGRESGWPWWSFALLILSGIILWYFFYDQRRKKAVGRAPLIDTALFKFRDLNIGLIAVFFHFIMHTSYLLLSAVFLQNGLGLSPLAAGLYFVAPGVLFTLSSFAAAHLIPKYGTPVLQVGVVIIILTFALQIAYFKPGVNVIVLFTLQALYGLGNGFVLPSLLNITLRSLPLQFAGAAAGIYSTVQQTSSALGICLIGGLFYYFIGLTKNVQLAYHYGLIVHIGCLVILSILLLCLPKTVQGTKTAHVAE
ncbi:drug resistance transporter, EmrB/QacA subfamily [Chitinophaga sp. YR627]|uniref:MFS transporter n=1 Tax=Chitinophaga sp. YR627 TaxID=1881041 RepID=UPI0008E70E09|nr:MFS transporter [Chitinophaga sp. YR627]SFM87914.1 drug resistance transporter, EmrB/QacA subfamily [Chitinophaga sp. YR627]